MLLGLLSDTHDDRDRTREALRILQQEGAEALLHMGDVTRPEMLPTFLDGWRAWVVTGNMDRDREGLRAAGEMCDPAIPVDATHELELGGVRIGMIHGHRGARLEGMVNGGAFDLVLHGHTHTFRDERVGGTRLVNPGAVHRADPPSVCTYDTEDDRLERHRI